MNVTRKPRLFFDEGTHPFAVTFDDGGRVRRNVPWSHYRCAEWDYEEPTAFRIEIGDWQVVVTGHNLAALFEAVASARLIRIQAHPEFAEDPTHEIDVFAVSIRFLRVESVSPKR